MSYDSTWRKKYALATFETQCVTFISCACWAREREREREREKENKLSNISRPARTVNLNGFALKSRWAKMCLLLLLLLPFPFSSTCYWLMLLQHKISSFLHFCLTTKIDACEQVSECGEGKRIKRRHKRMYVWVRTERGREKKWHRVSKGQM